MESLRVGSPVDILTERNIWYEGIVIKTMAVGGENYVVVSYRDWQRQYEEMVSEKEGRLATHRTHTMSNPFYEDWPMSQSQVSLLIISETEFNLPDLSLEDSIVTVTENRPIS